MQKKSFLVIAVVSLMLVAFLGGCKSDTALYKDLKVVNNTSASATVTYSTSSGKKSTTVNANSTTTIQIESGLSSIYVSADGKFVSNDSELLDMTASNPTYTLTANLAAVTFSNSTASSISITFYDYTSSGATHIIDWVQTIAPGASATLSKGSSMVGVTCKLSYNDTSFTFPAIGEETNVSL
jgi:hypothetical protein